MRRWQGRHPYLGGDHACQDCQAGQHSWTPAKVDVYALPYGQVRLHHFSCACSTCLLRCGAGLVHIDVVPEEEQTVEIMFAEGSAEEQVPLPTRAKGQNFWPDLLEDAKITKARTEVSKEDMERIIERLGEL